jgi:hypothetical protein
MAGKTPRGEDTILPERPEENEEPKDKSAQRKPSVETAYLRLFDPNNGCSEIPIKKPVITIGRARTCDIVLDSREVSREHAKISRNGSLFAIEDCLSTGGTLLNGQKIVRRQLKHRDTVQFSDFVIQFRTDKRAGAPEAGESNPDFDANRFGFLPGSMKVKYRFIHCPPGSVFAPGDTLPIGNGGIRLCCASRPPEDVCVELELNWPDGRSLRTFAEIIHFMRTEEGDQLCLKMHRLNKKTYEHAVENSEASDWTVSLSEEA